MRKYIILLLAVILFLSLVSSMYSILSVILTIIIFYCMIEKFGKGIVLLETMAFFGCIIYLLVPLLGYAVYNSDNRLAVVWRRTMPVSFEVYYGFMLPAICAYILGLFLINYLTGRPDEGNKLHTLISSVKRILEQKNNRGIIFIISGIGFYFIQKLVPGPLAAVASFGYLLIFPGLLHLHFQPPYKWKKWIYILVTIFFVRDAINTGMFTVFIYMGITIVSFFLIGRKIKLPLKLAAVVVAISAIFVLQLIKGSYRSTTWKGNYEGSKAELFQNLFIEKATGFEKIFSADAFFPIYARLNQGFTTAMVLKRIPAQQPFDDGESIAKTLAAAVVPRVLWPDKPESGGVYNMWHFAGFRLKGWSTNIGPVGEGYGNFGPAGGIIYMFFFGLFIGWAYQMVLKLSCQVPLLTLWIPLLFFEVMYAMENDTLQAVNSLVKAAFFIWVLYKIFPNLLTGKKILSVRKNNEDITHLRNNRPGWSLPR